MSIGLILECGPQGADKAVCEYLLDQLRRGVEVTSVTMDRKDRLVRECGDAAAALLAEGHERVVIVWDLNPSWDTSPSCLKKDREGIQASLRSAGVPLNRVHLVCIHMMLEAWLLSDERALSAFLSRPTHAVRVKRNKSPENAPDPKALLINLFRQHRGRSFRYNDLTHAIQLARAMPDLTRISRCPTFRRFAEKALDLHL